MRSGEADQPPWTPAAFEARFRADPDPWRFRTSAYEQARYARTLAWLRRAHYRRALEPGCANGELTARLARRCDRLLAFDVSPSALRAAGTRCRTAPPTVRFECRDLATFHARQRFDLVVLSEVGYYFAADVLRVIVHRLCTALEAGGELLAVHWLGHSADHRLSGDRVHEVVAEGAGLAGDGGERRAGPSGGFRIDRWVKE